MSDSAIAHAVFGLMFETSTEALFIVDNASGRIVSANVRVADLLALEVGQVIGSTFDQIALEPRDVSFDGRYEEVALRRGDDYPAFVTLTVAHINVDGLGFVTATIHTTSSGQGHETLVSTVIGEVLQIEPDLIRVVRPDSLA